MPTHPAKRRRITAHESQDWAASIQLAFVEALSITTGWQSESLIFHGGTSLAMSWGSPRFSEDLDFLINEHLVKDQAKFATLIEKVVQRMKNSLLFSHPGLEFELKDKTSGKNRRSALVHFQVVAGHPDVFEKVMVKTEFWPVTQDYLVGVKAENVRPASRLHNVVTKSISEIPAATLKSAVADKLTALATRPHLKWRDIFDLYWLRQMSKEDIEDVGRRFLHHVQAYDTRDARTPGDALRFWADHYGKEPKLSEVIRQAQTDLKPWMPPEIWRQFNDERIRRMVMLVADYARQVSEHVLSHAEEESGADALDWICGLDDEGDMGAELDRVRIKG